MHVPDHLFDTPIELAAGLGAAVVIGSVVRRIRHAPDADGPTLLRSPDGLEAQAATAALVFALQMVNVPVLAGTSGHLLGGALAAALVGPRRALLAVASVVAVQALLFADGGVGALGVNLWLIAIVPVAIAALAHRLLPSDAAHGPRWLTAVGLGAAAAPLAASASFSLLYVAGGSGASTGRVAGAMLATHAAIAIAEAAITFAAIGAIAWVGARRRAPDAAPVWGGAAIAALGLSLVASGAPDGLERVIGDVGIAIAGEGSIVSGSPLADYGISGVDASWATSAAGAIGLLATCLACALLALATRPDLGVRRAPVAP